VDENILYYVPKHKFLGGYFMPYIALNYANGELVANITGTNLTGGGGGSGFADTFVQPLNIGGHFGKRVDFNAGYAFTAPTGRFTQGASNNVGSGYWGNDIWLLYLELRFPFSRGSSCATPPKQTPSALTTKDASGENS
jgi:hypothetical protein